jgi:hypothetical protein
MAYYVTSDYSFYYEGTVKINVSDIEVTARPYPPCVWDGAAWTYPVDECRDYQKNVVIAAMDADYTTAIEDGKLNQPTMLAVIGILSDRLVYNENGAIAVADTPFMDGYGTQMGYTQAQTASDVDAFVAPIGVWLGKALAQRIQLYTQIDAETDGATVMTYVWVNI